MKIRFLFFSLISILACSEDPEFTGPPAARSVLRILDINVWSGLDYQGNLKMGEYETAAVREKRYRALITQIEELHPDIIGVHEANKLPDYAEKLASDLGYDVFYHVGVGGVRLGKSGCRGICAKATPFSPKEICGQSLPGAGSFQADTWAISSPFIFPTPLRSSP